MDDVAMKDRELFRGGASRSVIGPNGLSQVVFPEYQYVKLLKNKEVAQLEEDYVKELVVEKNCDNGQRKKKKNSAGSDNSVVNALLS
ncbi:hypothetical protein A2U01_0067235, partial [Trifolium medium]|nr:hypothetical protein [Trifolium medium]